MATSETGTSTSNPLGGEYQVFLSFRGPDTRRGFADVLYRDLSEAGIHVFIDYEEIRTGERIGDELLRAINDSRLYIPIFSPSYASSYWCLCELAMMVEKFSNSGEDEKKKVIFPIFYNVKADNVKLRVKSEYENQIQNLEQRMKDKKKNSNYADPDTWRQALKTVGGISGLDSDNFLGDGHLSKSVVDEVVNRLRTRQREVTEDLVGMENRISAINNLLDINARDVRLIGIYGMGGMGKTTLAKEIYNQLCPHFGKSCSFLGDVRKMTKTKGLVKLQEKLLSDLSNSRVARNIHYSDNGINAIEETICNKKVLVVLDDVDDREQIQKLIGSTFYPGTRILVTTRDSGVLNIRGLKYRFQHYELERLSDENALQLFSRHAFNSDSPLADYYTLSKGIVSIVGGLPLALKVIGASLFGKEKEVIWKETLRMLKKTLNKDVLEQLKISYDALEMNQKQIFLDIACFFIGEKKTDPVFVWHKCGFSPECAIDVLTKRCMIKVLDGNRFWMHDQLRDLGRAIAKKERTRLWDGDDIIHELRSQEEKRSVQALCFPWHEFDDSLTVTAEQIKRFPNLQFLWLPTTMQGNFIGCLSKLKWFYLGYASGSTYNDPMPTNLHLESVVVFKVWHHSWTKDAVTSIIKEATGLKVLFISNGCCTRETPTFSKNLALKRLSILECHALKEISRSIEKLMRLTHLDFEKCWRLEKLPKQIGKLEKLQRLFLRDCYNLRELPDSISELKSLMELDLYDCHTIQKLPKLPRSLTTLRLRSRSLQSVPDISNLTNLVELLLTNNYDQSDESDRPDLLNPLLDPFDWPCIGKFNTSDLSNIIQPCDLACIGRLSKLRKMYFGLLSVCTTSIEWGSLTLLEELWLGGVDLQMLKQLPSNLRVLWLECPQVKQVELDELPNLERSTFINCKTIAKISITSGLNKLRDVCVARCDNLVEVQFRGVLESMEILRIEDCKSFERLVSLLEEELGCNELQAPKLTNGKRRLSLVSSSLKMLRSLKLGRCSELQEIQFVSTLETLRKFSVYSCRSLKRIDGLLNLKNLECLTIEWCVKLQVVEGIDKLERLKSLEISNCILLERIIKASRSKIRKECSIDIWSCGLLFPSISSNSTQASDSAIETTFPEIGDHLSEQQDDSDDEDYRWEDDGDDRDYSWEDDDDNGSDEDDEDDEDKDHENDDGEDNRWEDDGDDKDYRWEEDDDDGSDEDDEDDEDKDHEKDDGQDYRWEDDGDDKDYRWEDDDDDGSDEDNEDDEDKDHENDDGEDDEVNDVHSSCWPLPDSSMDDNDENDDVNKEFEREADSNSNSKDDEDEDEDKDENEHEVLQSSRGPPLVCSEDDNDKNTEVKEEGQGDSNEDRMRVRKRNRGTMQKSKRSTMAVRRTTVTTMRMTRKTMVMKTTTRATTMSRTTTSTWTIMCRSICSCLAGLCEFFFFLWTTMMRRWKVEGEGECDGNDKDEEESDDEKPKRR